MWDEPRALDGEDGIGENLALGFSIHEWGVCVCVLATGSLFAVLEMIRWWKLSREQGWW